MFASCNMIKSITVFSVINRLYVPDCFCCMIHNFIFPFFFFLKHKECCNTNVSIIKQFHEYHQQCGDTFESYTLLEYESNERTSMNFGEVSQNSKDHLSFSVWLAFSSLYHTCPNLKELVAAPKDKY